MASPQPVHDKMYLSCCEGKHAFPDSQSASKIARRAIRSLEHYRCPVCGLWHVGTAKEVGR